MNNYSFDTGQTDNYSLCNHQKMFTFLKKAVLFVSSIIIYW